MSKVNEGKLDLILSQYLFHPCLLVLDMTNINTLYNRLLLFTCNIIKIASKLPRNITNDIIIKQIVRSSSSVGANFAEFIEAWSIKDKCSKINISRKEVKETIYWLDVLLMIDSCPEFTELKSEAIELAKILATIERNNQNNI
jgi:four helix bundle protein